MRAVTKNRFLYGLSDMWEMRGLFRDGFTGIQIPALHHYVTALKVDKGAAIVKQRSEFRV